MDDFRRLIRDYRENNHLTTAQLAKMTGVSPGTISNIETGKRGNPNKNTLDKILDVIKISSDSVQNSSNDKEFMKKEIDNQENRKRTTDEVNKSIFTFGVTDVSFNITGTSFNVTTSISNQINLNELSLAEQFKIKPRYMLEASIIVNTIADYLQENKDDLSSRIADNLNKEFGNPHY